MTSEKFIQLLRKEVNTYKSFLETDSQDWIVKGFIDIDEDDLNTVDRCLDITVDVHKWKVVLVTPEF